MAGFLFFIILIIGLVWAAKTKRLARWFDAVMAWARAKLHID